MQTWLVIRLHQFVYVVRLSEFSRQPEPYRIRRMERSRLIPRGLLRLFLFTVLPLSFIIAIPTALFIFVFGFYPRSN